MLDKSIETKKYVKKLLYIIENEPVFKFFKSYYVDKKRVDDIICCVEGSLPQDFRDYIKRTGDRNIKTYSSWTKALSHIKNKTFLSSSMYSVKISETKLALSNMLSAIDSDLNMLCKKP